MITVIFEVEIPPERRDDYLNLAANLKSELEQIDGFIAVERFQSLVNRDKLLSLSVFRDEAAVGIWRNHIMHREAQSAGRNGIFRSYRLRVASVIRDYGMHERAQAPNGNYIKDDSQIEHPDPRADMRGEG